MANYPYPLPRLAVPAIRVLLGLPSSISRDAALLIPGIQPPPRILGPENVPPETPFVLVFNHYDRPGLGAWWSAAVLLHAVAAQRTCEPRDVHVAMAREWWYPNGFGRLFKQPLTRWFFGRLAKSYGLVLLPPVVEQRPPRGEGALAIRRALALTRGRSPQLIGIAPEGRTGIHGELCEPPAGSGSFLLKLTHDSIPCLPAGIFEDEYDTLTVHFGRPFLLRADHTVPHERKDRLIAHEVMVHIGMLLPERMRGAYRAEIEKTTGGAKSQLRHHLF